MAKLFFVLQNLAMTIVVLLAIATQGQNLICRSDEIKYDAVISVKTDPILKVAMVRANNVQANESNTAKFTISATCDPSSLKTREHKPGNAIWNCVLKGDGGIIPNNQPVSGTTPVVKENASDWTVSPYSAVKCKWKLTYVITVKYPKLKISTGQHDSNANGLMYWYGKTETTLNFETVTEHTGVFYLGGAEGKMAPNFTINVYGGWGGKLMTLNGMSTGHSSWKLEMVPDLSTLTTDYGNVHDKKVGLWFNTSQLSTAYNSLVAFIKDDSLPESTINWTASFQNPDAYYQQDFEAFTIDKNKAEEVLKFIKDDCPAIQYYNLQGSNCADTAVKALGKAGIGLIKKDYTNIITIKYRDENNQLFERNVNKIALPELLNATVRKKLNP
jgi:hypothetical protein